MSAFTLTGTIVMQQRGCIEGSGQDYARLEAPEGKAELHLTNNTSSVIPVGTAVTLTADTASIGVGWDFNFSNMSITAINSGVTYDDVIATSGANTFSLHIPHPHGTGWTLVSKLNIGVKRV